MQVCRIHTSAKWRDTSHCNVRGVSHVVGLSLVRSSLVCFWKRVCYVCVQVFILLLNNTFTTRNTQENQRTPNIGRC